MSDYSDYRKWVEVEDWKNQEYLQAYEEYSPQDIYDLCDQLIQKAEAKGLKGCYLRFQSHNEPYEDFLGLPSVVVVGYRPLNQEELKSLEFEDEVERVATEKNIPIYQARQYL
jgi:hypothetical protein